MDELFILPHTHYDAEVFMTREEYLQVGYKVIIDALALLKAEPDYRYALDQSSFVKPFLETYPELAETFTDMVQQGRLEIIGGMYVMSDLNMCSGESIVRQFEFGKDYYLEKLGIDVRAGWMIDTFGHCRQMPQIMKQCGFSYYFFSRVADLKHSEFFWQGIDGTKIAAHWMPYHYGVFSGSPDWYPGFHDFVIDRYNKLKPFSMTEAIAAPEGGDFTHPVHHDPQYVKKWNADPDRPFELTIATPSQFFESVLKHKPDLDVITDEMNPVFQGCYSARILIKQMNRYLENKLAEAELWNYLSHYYIGCDMTPQITNAWEPVLFNQVHDIIGGVQMDKVYNGVKKRYMQSENLIDLTLDQSYDQIVSLIDTQGDGVPVVVFNSLSWECADVVTVNAAFEDEDTFDVSALNSSGISVPSQLEISMRHKNGSIQQASIMFIAKVPAHGYEVYRVKKRETKRQKQSYSSMIAYGMQELNIAALENEYYKVKFDMWKGCILSLVLKETGEEFIDQSMPYGNMLVQEEDNGDFWEIGTPLRGAANRPIENIHPLDCDKNGTVISITQGGTCSIRENDVVSEFEFTQKLDKYEFSTIVRLVTGIKRVDIASRITNRVKHVRYRIAFPTTIKNGKISQEIPFGCVTRPEGEYPALNWVDYSQSDKGLGIVNCGLPGNAVVDDKMMVSLLKCSSFVSYGDVGGFDSKNSSEEGHEINVLHNFRYALVPHQGDWHAAGLHRHGAEINRPLVVKKTSNHKGSLPPKKSFISINCSQIMVSTIRKFDQGLLLRIYETTGKRADNVQIELFNGMKNAFEVNLLGKIQDHSNGLSVNDNMLTVNLRPFEIKTLLIK